MRVPYTGVFRGRVLLDGVVGSYAGTLITITDVVGTPLAYGNTDASGSFQITAEVSRSAAFRVLAHPLRASHLWGSQVVYFPDDHSIHETSLLGTLAGGDVLRHGAVAAADMVALGELIGEDASVEESEAWYADLDHDGTVTENDLLILIRGFGKLAGAGAWVEE